METLRGGPQVQAGQSHTHAHTHMPRLSSPWPWQWVAGRCRHPQLCWGKLCWQGPRKTSEKKKYVRPSRGRGRTRVRGNSGRRAASLMKYRLLTGQEGRGSAVNSSHAVKSDSSSLVTDPRRFYCAYTLWAPLKSGGCMDQQLEDGWMHKEEGFIHTHPYPPLLQRMVTTCWLVSANAVLLKFIYTFWINGFLENVPKNVEEWTHGPNGA